MVTVADPAQNGSTTAQPWVAGDTLRFPEKPTSEQVIGLLSSYKSYYQTFHAQCREEDTYFFGRNVVPAPVGIDPVRPATAYAIVTTGAAHIDTNNIAIDVPLASVRAQARAEKLKKFYIGTWLSQDGPILETAKRHMFQYGIAVLKDMFAAEAWPDSPREEQFLTGILEEDGTPSIDESAFKEALSTWLERRRATFPLLTRNVNPKNLIWDDSKNGPKWVIEFYDRMARDVRRLYPEWISDKSGAEMATWLEYWDDTWCGYMADHQWVWGPFRHGYGFMPYSFAMPLNALDWDSGPPHDRYRGMLNPIHNLLDTEARLTTQLEAIVRTTAWRTLDFSGPATAVKATMDTYQLHGGMNEIKPGVTVGLSPLSQLPPGIMQELDAVQNQIEMATFPNVIRGVRPRGVSAGFAISALAGMGRLVFQNYADGLARALQVSNRHKALLVQNKLRGASITVHARSDIHNFDQTINARDVNGYTENKVTLKAEAPEERERESILAERLFNAQLISRYEAMRRIGIPNPLEEGMQIAAEQLLEQLRPAQVEEAQARLAGALAGQQAEVAQGVGPTDLGNQFRPGQAQLQRPGEAAIQRQRLATNAEPSVFPQGRGGIDILGRLLGGSPGGAQGMPSGQVVR